VRLTVAFLTVLSLLLFRSYYLPSPDLEESNASTPKPWWRNPSSSWSDDTGDVDIDVEGEYRSTHHAHLVSEITDFTDYSDYEDSIISPHSSAASSSETSSTASTASTASAEEWADSAATLASSFPSASPTTARRPALNPYVPACRQLPGADKVVIIVKTGATEVFSRVPEQLITLAECVPNLMIFSDMEQDLGHFHIYDALNEIGKEYRENHEDFVFYNAIHNAHAMHGDVSVLGSDKAWNLDKWKNIPMLHKAYTKYPDADWFMTIDADTYLGWTNLLLLLDRMDPEDPLYAGCVYWHGPTAFAQGGTGYLLSRKSVEKFEDVRNPEKIADWEKETSTICCGDVMLAVAMGHAGVSVRGAWPMFQVDPPCALSWADRYWCTPAITWHHVHSYDIESLWQFEKDWINKTWDDEDPGSVPYLFKDVFEELVEPHIAQEKPDWNNYSGDKIFTKPVEDHVKEDHDWDGKNDEEKQELWDSLNEIQQKATESLQDCRNACGDDENCLQFSWHPGTCKLNYSIRMGHVVDPKEEVTSGWMIPRVEDMKESRGPCKEPQWGPD
jgi:hypothetical protein